MKHFIYFVIAIVAASVIAGFFVAGSPKEERAIRLDNRRISDLQFLQSEILYFWQNKSRLPEKLAELQDDIRGVYLSRDPETGADYTYEVKNSETFALCATFVRENRTSSLDGAPKPVSIQRYEPFGQNWEHSAGYFCFERTIDPELYPALKKDRW